MHEQKPPPPEPPFMRIGDHGETVNPRTGERIPPPTTEWRRAPGGSYNWLWPLVALWVAGLGFYTGYKFPRDVELESTAPVEFHYEVTPEAARLLVLRDVKGCK